MRLNPQRWLLLAGALHITLTLAIFLVGHFQLLPNLVDPYGTFGTVSPLSVDAAAYRNLASDLANELQTTGISGWLTFKAPLNSSLFSLLFEAIGRVLGHNIVADEPLNLIYYLGIIV